MDENEIIEMLAREKRIIIDDTDPIFAQYHLNEILISSKFFKFSTSSFFEKSAEIAET